MERGERNALRQWLSKGKEQGDVFTGADHVSRQTWFGQERDLVVVKLFGARASVGELSLCYTIEGLMLESFCDMPHVQVTVVALRLPSKVAERA